MYMADTDESLVYGLHIVNWKVGSSNALREVARGISHFFLDVGCSM
jgi:hypothetical protein